MSQIHEKLRMTQMTRIKDSTNRKMKLIIYITNKTNLSYKYNVRTLKNSHQN